MNLRVSQNLKKHVTSTRTCTYSYKRKLVKIVYLWSLLILFCYFSRYSYFGSFSQSSFYYADSVNSGCTVIGPSNSLSRMFS